MASSFSAFEFDADVYSMSEVLDFLKISGFDVKRTKRLDFYSEHDKKEVGYQVIGTDVTIADPLYHKMYQLNTISIYCPVANLEDPIARAHDSALNKKVFNKLKRKFSMKLLPPHMRENA